MSSDGSIINVVTYDEYRYTSIDYGNNWSLYSDTFIFNGDSYTYTTEPQKWSSVVNTGGGTLVFTCINGGQLNFSKNINKSVYGRTIYTSKWHSISCSESGKYVSACSSNDIIYNSFDFGNSWTKSESLSLNWNSISISRGYKDANSEIGLRAGDYISYNSSTGSIDKWTTPIYVDNFSSKTGTSDTGNKNYMSSLDGKIQVVAATDNSAYYSWDNGLTWYLQSNSDLGTDDMSISNDGQYSLYTKKGVENKYNTQLQTSDYFGKSRVTNYSNNSPGQIENYHTAMSENGKYQFFIADSLYIFYKKNYNDSSNDLYWPSQNIYFPNSYSGQLTYIDSFVNLNGDISILYTDENHGILITGSSISDYTSWTQIDLNYNVDIKSMSQTSDGNCITIVGFDYNIYNPIIFTINSGIVKFTNDFVWYEYTVGIGNSAVKVSSSGQYQVVTWTYRSYYDQPVIPSVVYYSNDYGQTWTKTNQNYYLNILRAKRPIIANDDFSYITICGGFSKGNVSAGIVYNITPCTYYSTDRGVTWNFNSSINPTTQIQTLAFYYPKVQKNKTYFQIKDNKQSQVLGVSDNGFKMSRDLRVTNSNAYVIGGTMTIGQDEASSLLNSYSLNVDGTISCRNIVTLSDKRFKNVLGKISDKESYNNISKINIINYKYIDRPNDNRIYTGMVAQEVHDVLNDAVDIKSSIYKNQDGSIELPDVYSIKYNVIVSYLISAFKQSQIYINNLEKENENLKNEIYKTNSEISNIKNKLNIM